MRKSVTFLVPGVWVAAAVALILPLSTTAERPFADHRGAARLSADAVLESLGPGPLPPSRGRADRSDDRFKADSLSESIDRCVERDMSRSNAPGAAVAIVLDGELVYESGYGVKRRGGTDSVDPATVFRIGSVTKQMAAAAVLQQVELGRVDLDAPLTTYIPELEVGGRWPADRFTVWHALTHTSGYPDWIEPLFLTGDSALSIWAGSQSGVELHAPPGSFWNYSNPNFMLAGLVAERAAGTPYRDLFRESLWEPAGMTSTTFDPLQVVAWGNYSYGHYYDAAEDREYVLGPRDNDLWVLGPAVGAFSNVVDLVRWALLLMDGGGPVLSPWSAATMQDRQQWMHYTPDLFYGYGVMIEAYEGLDVRQHGGNVAGYGTYLLWVPERRFAVALLTNVTSSLSNAAYCIVDKVLDPADVDAPDLSTDPSTWRRYVGDYVITDSQGVSAEARVYLDGNRLMGSVVDPAQPTTIVTTRLHQAFLDTFLYDSDGNGVTDSDLTFCSTRGDPGIVMWLRNRNAVGIRELTPRAVGGTVAP